MLKALAVTFLFSFCSMDSKGLESPLIPRPNVMVQKDGYFSIQPDTKVMADSMTRPAGELLSRWLSSALQVGEAGDGKGIVLTTTQGMEVMPREGYRLMVEPDMIRITAADEAGAFYAVQTLKQLCMIEKGRIPFVEIHDAPRFPWRGLMLDCSRTFQSMDYLKKTLDRMAFYKMNTLHLHLTDDQGWRLEIKRFPELTRKGAFFPEKYNEPASRQGFYAQEEMKELVRYAAERHITVVPEIELPGHSLAALSCFPELSCTGEPLEIYPFFKGPGITKEIFCAGNEETFRFFEQVFEEVVTLFPSPFIHVGGDEVPKEQWKACPRCRARIKEMGLKDEHELQSYFIQRAEKILNRLGRRLIGWDEILEGGPAPNAAVMSWRGTRGGIAAARMGHHVVMSPTSHCYFDYPYKRIDTQRAYLFEPVPSTLTIGEARFILGIQANFWSHIDRSPERVDHQLFPRLLSVAERAWSPGEVRDWPGFKRRVKFHLDQLENMGVRYNREDPSLP